VSILLKLSVTYLVLTEQLLILLLELLQALQQSQQMVFLPLLLLESQLLLPQVLM
jgi:hypothetical protein